MPQMTIDILIISFCLFTGLQLLYWLYFIVGLLRGKPGTVTKNSNGISVVVAAQNEIHNLRALVPRLLQQKHGNFEVIIVNDRSDDGTLEFLVDQEKHTENLKALHIHERPEHINGKKYALTLGIKAASHENILLTDTDCLPMSEHWLATMANGYEDKDFVLGFSGYTKLKGLLNYFIRYETILNGIQYLAAAINGRAYMGVGRNMGYKKSLFLQKKGFLGFQEVMGGDDDLFVNRYATSKNTVVVLGKEALVLSTPKLTWKSFLRQKHRHLSVGKHYRFASKLKIGLFNFSWAVYIILLVPVLFSHFDSIIVGTLVAGRLLLLILTFFTATKRLGYPIGIPGLIILDLVYPFYYIFVGARSVLIKTVSWA